MTTDEYYSDLLAQLGASRLTEARRLLEAHIKDREKYQLILNDARDKLESSNQSPDSRLARLIPGCEEVLRQMDAEEVQMRELVERCENFLLNLPKTEQ